MRQKGQFELSSPFAEGEEEEEEEGSNDLSGTWGAIVYGSCSSTVPDRQDTGRRMQLLVFLV